MNLLLMGVRTFSTTVLAIVGASAVVAGGIAGFVTSRVMDSDEVAKARKDEKAKAEAKAEAKDEKDEKAKDEKAKAK